MFGGLKCQETSSFGESEWVGDLKYSLTDQVISIKSATCGTSSICVLARAGKVREVRELRKQRGGSSVSFDICRGG